MTTNTRERLLQHGSSIVIEAISALVLLAGEQERFPQEKELDERLRSLTRLVGPENLDELITRARELEKELVLPSSTLMFTSALSNALTDLEVMAASEAHDDRFISIALEDEISEDDYIDPQAIQRGIDMLANDATQAEVIIQVMEQRGIQLVLELIGGQPYTTNGVTESELRRKILTGDLTMSEFCQLLLCLELLVEYRINGEPVSEEGRATLKKELGNREKDSHEPLMLAVSAESQENSEEYQKKENQ